MPEAFHHRPGALKQTNKNFKSKHATKSSLKELAKGKVQRPSPKASSASNAAAQSKLNRRNHAKQTQSTKRQALVSATRIFSGVDGAPRIVAVVPLTEDVNAKAAASALAASLDVSVDDMPEQGIWKIKAERFRTSLQFINLAYRDLYATLDACKAADYVVFILSPTVEVTPWGDMLLRTLQAQGLPDVVSVIAPGYPIDPKTRPGILKSLLSFMQYFAPEQSRVFDLEVGSDRLSALRMLSEGKPGDVRWREGRAWLLGEKVEWEETSGEGTLKVTGVVRGAQLSSNRLVHLPNYGDFQISRIESAPLLRQSKGHGTTMDVEPSLLAEANADDADSLVSSNDPDEMENEQTWPTEEEMQDASQMGDDQPEIPSARNGTTPKSVKIPKGMSAYQAAWIVDDDDDADGEDREGEGENGADEIMADEEGGEPEEMVDFAEVQEMESESRKSVAFQDLDVEEEERQLEDWRQRKREEQDDLEFPDEIDTPKEIPARTRFQRYRGLKSFRTSPWDPYENLPRDYARIFQFEDFKRTERNIFRRAEEEGAGISPGTRVTVFLKNCTKEMSEHDPSRPFVIFGLLQHEHKKSVLNFTVQRNTEYDGSVRSKDPLILCIGPRRLRINPIYSQHTRGGGKGPNNVHKFERYLRHGNTSVMTTYGPLVFGKQPCALLRETSDPQAPELVAMGTFMNPDTTRIVAKKIVLSGHPFKVHKKTATVRYMFFNQDDVLYFKPIQLHTKHGRTGHIKESLGTHGYFKAHFDGPINQMDTICMSLYKRVYPKWGELWTEKRGLGASEGREKDVDAMEE
ncbi:ribosome biogenesis protein tsr1 [Stereum hirsutum FP-91666 SS1]|uniref:ribosome biogenesis protein tsr1 n=1 Tax=Stereum hirsutum (strain FP-91666) TaxID=721885 RepID=UPI000444A8E4|nr:ribosome biogenesis protein tsr1 [Stereum hirsutum FP-91666 SS1]EIM82849.1 ribosome biogenesis protein tsr1 [Stereum hirsutum FP-91666 SS1]